MDQEYMEKMGEAFLEELTEIEKQALGLGGVWRFLRAGGKRLAGMGKALKGGAGATEAIGGAGARRAGGILEHMKQIYHGGATGRGARTILGPGGPITVGAQRGGGGVLGGVSALARSRYGQMAAIPLAAGGTLWAGKKLLGGGQQPQYG